MYQCPLFAITQTRLFNQDEVVAALKAQAQPLGYTLETPSFHGADICPQGKVVSRGNVLTGMHGMAFALMPFLEPCSLVFEIHPPHANGVQVKCFQLAARGIGHFWVPYHFKGQRVDPEDYTKALGAAISTWQQQRPACLASLGLQAP